MKRFVIHTLWMASFVARALLADGIPQDNMVSTLAKLGPPPAGYDSRTLPGFPSVWDQYHNVNGNDSCGSCWAFASTGAMQIGLALAYPQYAAVIPQLSTQQLVDCVGHGGIHPDNCNGGNIGDTVTYLESNPQTSWLNMPYLGENEACPTQITDPIAKATRGAVVEPSSEVFGKPQNPLAIENTQLAIEAYGSVVTTIYAGTAFSHYTGGIFGANPADCATPLNSDGSPHTNHVITLVGWGTGGGQFYWILRNSFGSGWGENGYMWIKYGTSNVGYAANYVSY